MLVLWRVFQRTSRTGQMSPSFGSKSINLTKDNTARHGRAIASLSEQQQRARLELKHAGTPLNHQEYDLVIQDPSKSGI